MTFRAPSTTLNSRLTKDIRQAEGIYFTPAAVRNRLFELLAPHISDPKTILEPSFGSGEFLFDAEERFPSATTIYGIELNRDNFHETCHAIASDTSRTHSQLHLQNADFLKPLSPSPIVDLVIGNPPYFTTSIKDPRCVKGRSNIFILFLYKCLTEHLAANGILAFVLPTSLYNCIYYDPCRAYIRDHTTLLAVETISGTTAGFYDTVQDTVLLVLLNRPPTTIPPPFILEIPGTHTVYISPHAAEIRSLTTTATTLRALGCSVKTGEVVWNQHKDRLVDAATPVTSDTTLLIYANNIKDQTLQLGNPGKNKKQYIRGFPGPAPTTGPALLVTRGYGNTAYNLQYALVPAGIVFYGENHVNVITGPPAAIALATASLADPRTSTFLEMFVGNGALSKTELECVLPIWV